MIPRVRHVRATVGAALLVIVGAAAACGSGSFASPAPNGKIQVTAAENFWGSIASQLGGNKVAVTSIIANPDTDPHSYQPTANDARAITTAGVVIFNGSGYDPWVQKLLATNTGAGPTTLNVGQLVGVPDGGNPHRWYSPSDVQTVITTITADYKKVDPGDAAYFDTQNQSFVQSGLAQYSQLIAQIKSRYPGVPVGASESIFAPMAQALGLNLLTPPSFLKAVSEGTDPTAQDKATIDAQIKGHQIKVYVYNSQNATPDVQAQVKEARAAGIPVTTITETLAPPSSTFQAWQVRELQGLAAALGRATGQ
ncbi:MAG TPA: zinc ABC transporter substrate-binding protein [Acidimicrobiales bacterium]